MGKLPANPYKNIKMMNEKTSSNNKEVKNRMNTIKRIWKYLSVYRTTLIFVILMVVASSVFGLLGPYLIGYTIDEYFVPGKYNELTTILLWLGVIFLVYSVSIFLQNYWMIGIAQKTVFQMRLELFQHLHKLPVRYFDTKKQGELMSRVINDIENVSSTLNSSVIQIFSSILTLTGTVTIMLLLSPYMTLITLTIVPMMFFGMKWITNRTSVLFKLQQKNLGELNGFIEETISGQKIIKTFSQEERVVQEFLEKNEQLRQSGYWAQTYSGFIPKLMNVLNNFSFAIIAFIGGIFALYDLVTIGEIVIFTEYARQFTRPLNDLANQFNTLLSAIAGAERVFDVLDSEVETIDEQKATKIEKVKGNVEFKNVYFSYEKDNETLTDINFTVKAGQTVALVGPTGAGKTTIIQLLSRFYETDSGGIYIDGREIKSIQRESLRSHMGFVLQDSFLFETTIMENIRFGRLNATDEEVVEAAKKANAHSFIMRLPNKYETVLSQDGAGISQGQRQLLTIARAILRNPSILILDEATSSIDTITELKIQDALRKLMYGRTSFVIAHRLNTIQNADLILVLNNGKIIEKGTHESLLEEKGFYFQLYQNLEKEQSVG